MQTAVATPVLGQSTAPFTFVDRKPDGTALVAEIKLGLSPSHLPPGGTPWNNERSKTRR
jgi:hypothetical protein